MLRFSILTICALVAGSSAACSSDPEFPWTFTSRQFGTTPVFGDVQSFAFKIELAVPLTAGSVLVNPALAEVNYEVTGFLVPGTPSGFEAFELERTIAGAAFYPQGSSLRLEIAPDAELGDGLQISDLAGTSAVFTFDGREIDNGRFHPAILELNADGTGRIQNSNNVPTLNPRLDVAYGEEYITDLTFDPTTLTVVESAGSL